MLRRTLTATGGRQKQANWNETDVNSPSYIQNKPDLTGALTREFVDELPDPQDAQANVIYMVPKQDAETGDGYNEYLLNPDTMEFELIGSTSVEANPAHPFKPEWHTDTTLAAFVADVNADTDAVEGTYFSGELTCTGLPNAIGNAECRVDVLTGSTSLDKIFVLTIYSTNVAPYHYELMVDGGVAGTWHWTGDGTITVQRNGQTAGSFTTNQNNNTTIDIEVPEFTSDLINDTDVYLTEEEYEALEAAGQLDEEKNYHIQGKIPSKTSELDNDSGFITVSEVPSPNDGTLTIQRNSVTAGTFTANQSGDSTVDIDVPVNTSDLVNDTDVYLTQDEFDALEQQGQLQEDKNYHVETVFADVAVTGSYNDLTDKPTIPAAQVQSNWSESDSAAASYIQNKPTIPSCNNKYDLSTKSQAELVDFYTNYTTIMDANTLYWEDYPVVSVGTYTDSQLGITAVLVEYNPFAISSVFLGGAYNTLAAGVKSILPDGSVQDASTTMKLADADHLATVATSGSYADLSNKPTIPAAQVNSDWNASSGLAEILNKPTGIATGYNGTAYTLRPISQTDYDNLGTYDPSVIYLIS